jgi:hypothetical protein
MKHLTRILSFSFVMLFVGFLSSCHAGKPSQNDDQLLHTSNPEWCTPVDNLAIYTHPEDIKIYEQVILDFEFTSDANKQLNKLIPALGRWFLNTPYVASTLEIDGEEQLVVNLRGMDCTTFVEYVLALALTIQKGEMSFGDYANNVACIRYRDGILNGYPSRLHYFTEWLQNNAAKGIISLTSNDIGTQPFNARVHFMSTNPDSYMQLKNPEYLKEIQETEKTVSAYQMNFIPKDQIKLLESNIYDGDIIAFTTDIDGLDVSHTGFAIHQEGRLHLLHASTRSNMVEITAVPLSDYLQPMRRVTGILVGRVVNP